METTKLKTWRFDDPTSLTSEDFRWLSNNCAAVDYDSGADPITLDYRGSQFMVQSRTPVLTFITNSDKQETMVQLKYSGRIILDSCVEINSVCLKI